MAFFKKMEAIKNESEERTWGNFPSAKEIRNNERKEEAARDRASMRALHRTGSPADSMQSTSQMRGPSPVRPQTKARRTMQSSFPLTARMRMPTSARPSHNRAYGADVTPLYNNRFERSKTDIPIRQSYLGADHIPTEVMTDRPDSAKKPYFLTELQLPHLENRKSGFRNTVAVRPRHHMIHPEWVSEGMVIKRLRMEHRSNPLLYGWI